MVPEKGENVRKNCAPSALSHPTLGGKLLFAQMDRWGSPHRSWKTCILMAAKSPVREISSHIHGEVVELRNHRPRTVERCKGEHGFCRLPESRQVTFAYPADLAALLGTDPFFSANGKKKGLKTKIAMVASAPTLASLVRIYFSNIFSAWQRQTHGS